MWHLLNKDCVCSLKCKNFKGGLIEYKHSLKHGKYYWCRLYTWKRKSLFKFGSKDIGQISWSFTLLLADVFQNFRNMDLETYDTDIAALTVPILAWQIAWKSNKVVYIF